MTYGHKKALWDIGSVGVDPVLDIRVLVVEQVGLHLLRSLCLSLVGVGRDTSADIMLLVEIVKSMRVLFSLLVDENADAFLF